MQGWPAVANTEVAAVHCATDEPELIGVDVSGRIFAWKLK